VVSAPPPSLHSAGSGMIGVNWNDGHGLLGLDGGETLSAHPPICAQGHQQNHNKNEKETDDTILKKIFLWVLMHICIAVCIFLKEITP
jgi:hypothetical protein